MGRNRVAALAAAALAAAVSCADAGTTRPELVINADQSTAVAAPGGDHGQAVYVGHVIITRGAAVVHGDKAIVFTQNGNLERAVVTGTPATFAWNSNDGRPVDGHASTITYLAASDTVVLTGNVVVVRGGEHFSAAEVHYDLESETLSAWSSDQEGGQRVHVVMPPAPASGGRP